MQQEIERKFLVRGAFKSDASGFARIVQGYLSSAAERTVRIRIQGAQGFITVKGKSSRDGLKRYEWEKEIPLEDARELLQLCEPGVIDKTRYRVPWKGHLFEVDEFHGENAGLVMAEIELENGGETFERPGWLGREVTGDLRYYNVKLACRPYLTWKKQEAGDAASEEKVP